MFFGHLPIDHPAKELFMKNALFTLAAVAMLSACGNSQDSSSDISRSIRRPVVSKTLTSGEYIVKVGRFDFCSESELNIDHSYTYRSNARELKQDRINLYVAGIVSSNRISPAVCRESWSTGLARVSIPAGKKMEVKVDVNAELTKGIQILSVEKVVKTKKVEAEAVTDGTFLFTAETEAQCRNQEINIDFSRTFDGLDVSSVLINTGNLVTDNLIRPMICRVGELIASGTDVVSVNSGKVTVKSTDVVEVKEIRKVLETKTISL